MSDSSSLPWYWIVIIVVCSLLGLVLIAYIYRLWVSGRKYTKSNRIPGKIVIITGANAGIGKETAVELARRGAKVYMACRSIERGEKSWKEVILRSGNNDVHLRQLNLASIKSIRKFAEEFLKQETRLDILINNAGVMACPRSETEDGFEMQIGTNHLGHFLLTKLLLELIKKSAPARIVNVSSVLHKYGKINKDDLMYTKNYEPLVAYAQSKLANVLFTKELARRLKDDTVSVYALHPGAINTDLLRHMGDSYGPVIRFLRRYGVPMFFKTVVEGAQTTLKCALDPNLQNVSGEYFDNCAVAKVNRLAKDEELARWLWNESEGLVQNMEKIVE